MKVTLTYSGVVRLSLAVGIRILKKLIKSEKVVNPIKFSDNKVISNLERQLELMDKEHIGLPCANPRNF